MKKTQKYLPVNKDEKLYSPIGVRGLFKNAVAAEDGDIQAVFNKTNKYKQLIELWHASALAVAVYKWRGDKFYMYPSDNPDIHFVKKGANGEQEGFSVEISTLYNHGEETFDENYKKLVSDVWEKKGNTDYDRSELLLVSRLTGKINVDKLAREISMYKWNFLRIWLSVYNGSNKTWALFEISPYENTDEVGKITIGLSEFPY